MTVLLGGDACPLGLNVQFLEAPPDQVVPVLASIWSPAVISDSGTSFPDSLASLLPFESPWTRMLVAPAGRWTAVVNNGVDGGDSTAPGPAVARTLDIQCVIAEHAPRYGPGHAATQLIVEGPGGEGSLRTIRTISAHATDGRWAWDESGVAFDFEETEGYAERLVRHRFDREKLLRYLAALGIPIEDAAYGNATLVQQTVDWPRREQTLAEARALFGLR